MIFRYLIEPCNEPHGTGNGWVFCSDDKATLFLVWNILGDDGPGAAEECLASFPTRAEAQKYIAKLLEQGP